MQGAEALCVCPQKERAGAAMSAQNPEVPARPALRQSPLYMIVLDLHAQARAARTQRTFRFSDNFRKSRPSLIHMGPDSGTGGAGRSASTADGLAVLRTQNEDCFCAFRRLCSRRLRSRGREQMAQNMNTHWNHRMRSPRASVNSASEIDSGSPAFAAVSDDCKGCIH